MWSDLTAASPLGRTSPRSILSQVLWAHLPWATSSLRPCPPPLAPFLLLSGMSHLSRSGQAEKSPWDFYLLLARPRVGERGDIIFMDSLTSCTNWVYQGERQLGVLPRGNINRTAFSFLLSIGFLKQPQALAGKTAKIWGSDWCWWKWFLP